MGIKQSMGRPGSALDNAVIEAWHSTLTFELRALGHFATKAHARARVAAWIDTTATGATQPATCALRSTTNCGCAPPTSPTRRPRHDRHHPPEHGTVLAGVNTTPYGWPAASVDTGCGRHRSAPVGAGQEGTSTDQDPHNKSLYGIRGLTQQPDGLSVPREWRARSTAASGLRPKGQYLARGASPAGTGSRKHPAQPWHGTSDAFSAAGSTLPVVSSRMRG
jgi:hypothetical protein